MQKVWITCKHNPAMQIYIYIYIYYICIYIAYKHTWNIYAKQSQTSNNNT